MFAHLGCSCFLLFHFTLRQEVKEVKTQEHNIKLTGTKVTKKEVRSFLFETTTFEESRTKGTKNLK